MSTSDYYKGHSKLIIRRTQATIGRTSGLGIVYRFGHKGFGLWA